MSHSQEVIKCLILKKLLYILSLQDSIYTLVLLFKRVSNGNASHNGWLRVGVKHGDVMSKELLEKTLNPRRQVFASSRAPNARPGSVSGVKRHDRIFDLNDMFASK